MILKEENADSENKFAEFCTTVSRLVDPAQGCPWMLNQSHQSLLKYLFEEAFEVEACIEQGMDDDQLAEELGDVLLQVVLHSKIAAKAGRFDISQVIEKADQKMKRRHPHVFSADEQSPPLTLSQVNEQWEAIKKSEKGLLLNREGLFQDLEKIVPASQQAFKIGQKAHQIGFDWEKPSQVFSILKSEVEEVEEALARMELDRADSVNHLQDELGDLFFAASQLVRHLKWDPESIARRGNQKFLRRFALLESLMKQDGIDFKSASTQMKERYWVLAKEHEKKD